MTDQELRAAFAVRLRSLISDRAYPVIQLDHPVPVTRRFVTISDVARAIGTDYTRLRSWLNAETMPRIPLLIKLADYFGVSTDYLLCLTGNKERNA